MSSSGAVLGRGGVSVDARFVPPLQGVSLARPHRRQLLGAGRSDQFNLTAHSQVLLQTNRMGASPLRAAQTQIHKLGGVRPAWAALAPSFGGFWPNLGELGRHLWAMSAGIGRTWTRCRCVEPSILNRISWVRSVRRAGRPTARRPARQTDRPPDRPPRQPCSAASVVVSAQDVTSVRASLPSRQRR